MDEKNRTTIYFGFDESNHAGPNRKGEIVVATYSISQEDSIVREWPNRRAYSKVEKWLEDLDNDYQFTILTGEKYRCKSSAANLTEAAPRLVEQILTMPENLFNPEKIKLYFDGGGFGREQKEFLREHFKGLGIDEVIVDNFIKKNKNRRGKTRKGPRCPKLVYLADILANHLDSLTAGELFNHPNFLPFFP